jgi:hypothetical protein
MTANHNFKDCSGKASAVITNPTPRLQRADSSLRSGGLQLHGPPPVAHWSCNVASMQYGQDACCYYICHLLPSMLPARWLLHSVQYTPCCPRMQGQQLVRVLASTQQKARLE